MKKRANKIGTILTTFAVLVASFTNLSNVKAADIDTAMENEPDPFFVEQDNIQPYDTGNLKLNKGLTYTKDGQEIEVTGAIDTMDFCADPTSMEVDGKLYMYATLDQRSYASNFDASGKAIDNTNDPSNGKVIANKYQTKKLAIYSTSDLVNWTDEGVIDLEKVFSESGIAASTAWAWNSWAPTAMKYDSDGDGKDEYYVFFTNGGDIGYVKGETPTGPWKDELGKLLIKKSEIPNGMGDNIIWDFDPSVLLDDDGQAYIYWGGGNPSDAVGAKHPKTSRSCRMKILPDKVEMDWDTITELDSYYMFEDNEINKFQGKYVYSYCANWQVPSNNTYIQDGAAVSIVAYVSDDPLNVTSDPENYKEGEPKFLGAILKNPGEELFDEWYNNHHHMFEFNGKYYILYHTTALDQFLYKDFYATKNKKSMSYRNMHIDEIKVDVAGDNPTIEIKPTYEGPKQIQNFNPYQIIKATTQSNQGGLTRKIFEDGSVALDKIDTGDWTRIDNVDFGTDGATSLIASISSTTTEGSIEVYLDEALTGTKIATLNLEDTGTDNFETVSEKLNNATGVHDIYFVFRGEGYNVASWEFVSQSKEVPTVQPSTSAAPTSTPAISEPKTTAVTTVAPVATQVPSVSVDNKITLTKPIIKSLKNLKNKKVQIALKESIKYADGYEIRYSMKNNMKSSKKYTIKKATKLKATFGKLKKKLYYVQVRAYNKLNGKKYYSNWSNKKRITIKK